MSPYVIMTAVASFAFGGVVAGGIAQLTLTTQVTCTAMQEDPPRLPSSLFMKQPLPQTFKSY